MAGFAQERYSLSDTEVCLGVRAAFNSGNRDFVDLATGEAKRRGLPSAECQRLRDEHDRRAAIVALSVAAAIAGTAAVIGAAASSTGGGGYSGGGYSAPTDYDWAWDGFFKSDGTWVYYCRGRQTGEFAPAERCQYKVFHDNTWPSKSPPR